MEKRRRECRLLMILLSWWLVLFPEMAFGSGMCTAYQCEPDSESSAAEDTPAGGPIQVQMDGDALRELLFEAKPEQIEYKSFLREFLVRGRHTEE